MSNEVTDKQTESGTDRTARRRNIPLLLLGFTAPVALIGVLAYAWMLSTSGFGLDGGASILGSDGQTREQIQDYLDKSARDNMLTISVAARAELSDDGRLRINAENAASNRFAQRYTVLQNGAVLYASDAVTPGKEIEYCQADGAVPGDAVVEVQALDPETLTDHGSPMNISVAIVEKS